MNIKYTHTHTYIYSCCVVSACGLWTFVDGAANEFIFHDFSTISFVEISRNISFGDESYLFHNQKYENTRRVRSILMMVFSRLKDRCMPSQRILSQLLTPLNKLDYNLLRLELDSFFQLRTSDKNEWRKSRVSLPNSTSNIRAGVASIKKDLESFNENYRPS